MIALAAPAGCSSETGDKPGAQSVGGVSGITGGGPNAGSGGTSGGATAQGGLASGGKAAVTGGAATTGGMPSGGNGGTTSTGGGPSGTTGGVHVDGGAPPSGGTSGGMTNAGSGGGDQIPAIRFVGRMDTSDPAGPKFAWSGSGVIARFKGSSVAVRLGGGQEYAVVLDGTVQPKIAAMSGATTIAAGLADAEHTIELYRRTEASEGESQFLGFDFGGGQLLAPPPPKPRRLEIIGDSITCGYGNEGANMDCGFTPQTENHYATYGAIAARNLGAELITVAWSGKGVACNYGDGADSCMNPLPTYYDRILPNRADSAWDFSKYQPDAVVINLGTNDFSTDVDPSQSEFETAYKNFVQHLRSKYPNAYILCTNGSMLSGNDLTAVRSYIANVVKAMNDAGDTKVGSFEIEPQNANDGYGCDWHPNLVTHQKMAATLEAALKSALKW